MNVKTDSKGVKYIKMGDGYYSTANERILALKSFYPDSEIKTVMTYMPEIKSWYAMTSVFVVETTHDGIVTRYENTGHSCKSTEDGQWGRVACESAETTSVARAIAKLGIGIEYSNASYDEMLQSGKRVVSDTTDTDSYFFELDEVEIFDGFEQELNLKNKDREAALSRDAEITKELQKQIKRKQK